MVKDTESDLLSIFKFNPGFRRYMFNAGLVTPDGLVDPSIDVSDEDESVSMEYDSAAIKQDESSIRSFFKANPQITEKWVRQGWNSVTGDSTDNKDSPNEDDKANNESGEDDEGDDSDGEDNDGSSDDNNNEK